MSLREIPCDSPGWRKVQSGRSVASWRPYVIQLPSGEEVELAPLECLPPADLSAVQVLGQRGAAQ